jgi:DNA-binding CsgD family transcriptional regulator
MRGVVQARYGRWLEIVAELLQQPTLELPHKMIAHELIATFDVVGSAYYQRDRTGRASLQIWPEDQPAARSVSPAEALAITDVNPLLRFYTTTGNGASRSIGEVPASMADRRTIGAWRELTVPWGVEENLSIPLHVQGQAHRALTLARSGRDFTVQERTLARRLQPVLIGLERQAATLAQWRARIEQRAAQAQEGAEGVRLTPREVAVLTLLADGLTATAMARRLGIAPRTVHKHLEHIYAKFGASDRLKAVLRAQRLGILPTPNTPPTVFAGRAW